MSKNRLIIAAAGSGKTTKIVHEAVANKDKRILITTYTEANEDEIKKKIIKINGNIPSNITVQTWFSFLLQHGVKPYQGIMHDELYETSIRGMLLVNKQSGYKSRHRQGFPIYYSETDIFHHYFSKNMKIYSDKLSKFIVKCNEESKGKIIRRIENIFDIIYVDEIQDLAGNDLELIKLFFESAIFICLVGDPRQSTYVTHLEAKYKKYSYGKIKEFIMQECGHLDCEIDESSLSKSHRNNALICEFSCTIYPEYSRIFPCECPECHNSSVAKQGLFFLPKHEVADYLKEFNPMQLRWSVKTQVNKSYRVMNFGTSKGLTFDSVLIYPTKDMLAWITKTSYKLSDETRAKLYVGITRARYRVGFVI